MIERVPVDSSNIRSIGHDSKTNTLAVEFKSGAVYHYADVGKKIHDELMGAKSIGSHFIKNVRDVFKHTKQDDK
jgi:hypothetical protein